MSQSNLFSDPTYRISQLGEEIKLFLNEAFPRMWVVGEVQRFRNSARGHVYFELVEKGSGDEILGRMAAVLWRTNALRLRRELANSGLELAEGTQIRCRGRVDYWPPSGRLQFSVDAIDPVFSLGQLERRRRETLEWLRQANLIDKNQSCPLPLVPLRIGLITSVESAAYHDFLRSLESSSYGFQVLLVHAAVQGAAAEREVASALELLSGLKPDATVLVRGGGSRSDLAAFDSRRIAEAIAKHSVPVVCGLGHEIDRSVADAVAHTQVKTPTGAAEFLVRRVEAAEMAHRAAARQLMELSRSRLAEAERTLERSARRLVTVVQRTRRAADRVEELGRLLGRFAAQRVVVESKRVHAVRERLTREAPRRTSTAREASDGVVGRIVSLARWRVEQARRDCDATARLCRQIGPAKILARGFSITRDASGRVVKARDQLRPGDMMRTEFAEGTLQSRVESDS